MSKKLAEIEERYSRYFDGGDRNWRGYIGIMEIKDLEYLIETVKKYESALKQVETIDSEPWKYQMNAVHDLVEQTVQD